VKNKNKERTMQTLSVLQLLKLLSSANFASSSAPERPADGEITPPAEGTTPPVPASENPADEDRRSSSAAALGAFLSRHDSAVRHADKK
jgi:hypothetical protein